MIESNKINNQKKNQKKKILKYALLTILGLVVIIVLFNPLMRTTNQIRRNLLRTIPVGIHMDDVVDIIERHGRWKIAGTSVRFGVSLTPLDGRPSSASEFTSEHVEVVGQKRIRMHMGSYHIIFQRHVIVYFAFDADGYLLDIFVRKEIDLI